ncbi:DUF3883 domain-containing protein [Kitasatospora sp. NPDC087315]|uniref:DUF3883 domain-containing protein n=1 Tax=Kitasatospora sp. NPDC087315 TaxID=3364069 RepID=UPI003813AD71
METAQFVMTHVGQSVESQRNLLHGRETGTWGYPEWKPEYRDAARRPEFVVLVTGASPRVQLDQWLTETATLYFFQARGTFYDGKAPHWPDEEAAQTVKYQARLSIVPLGVFTGVPLGPSGPLSVQGSDALRRSGTDRGHGKLVRMSPQALLDLAGAGTTWHGGQSISVAGLPVVELDELPDNSPKRRRRGAGRISDPKKRKAIEEHAVAAARLHYELRGWQVEELGKPYDLRCTRPGAEKHVEVKGTTGAPTSVELTINEVEHARNPAHDVDLFVVSDIKVTTTADPYTTEGGTSLLIENWVPDDADLKPRRFEYFVPQDV